MVLPEEINRILVVDDEVEITSFLADLLKSEGYEVLTVNSGRQAIEEVKKKKFPVIMLDIKMPDLNGLEVLSCLKELSFDSEVILISGHGSMDDVIKALELGAYDYLTKPFENLEKIIQIIKKAQNKYVTTVKNKDTLKELTRNIERKTAELNVIYNFTKSSTATFELEKMLDAVLTCTLSVLDSEIGSVMLIDEKNGCLRIKAAKGLPPEIIRNACVEVGCSISGYVAASGNSLICKDVEGDSRFSRKNDERYYTKSFISVPLKVKEKTMGVININNKRSKASYTEEDLALLEVMASQISLVIENTRLYEELKDTYLKTISLLIDTLEIRDNYTAYHTRNVTKYTMAIAKELNLCQEELKDVTQAAQLHDIGKIGIPDYVLLKAGKLTQEEWVVIKTHPLIGASLVQSLPFLKKEIVEMIKQHHERYDGEGYPLGNKGDNIPLGARIIAVADTYEAMSSDRPYRKALPKETIIDELKKNSGSQFDPHIVEVFLEILEKKGEEYGKEEEQNISSR